MKNILICDDDSTIIEILTHLLGTHKLYTCSSLDVAKNVFEKYELDLVILDDKIRDKLGSSVIIEFAKINPNIKYVLMSGGEPTNIDDLQSNKVTFLQKPFSIDDILNIIID